MRSASRRDQATFHLLVSDDEDVGHPEAGTADFRAEFIGAHVRTGAQSAVSECLNDFVCIVGVLFADGHDRGLLVRKPRMTPPVCSMYRD